MAVFLFVAAMICQIYLSSKQLNCGTKIYLPIILGTSIFTIVPETQYVYVNDTVTFEKIIFSKKLLEKIIRMENSLVAIFDKIWPMTMYYSTGTLA